MSRNHGGSERVRGAGGIAGTGSPDLFVQQFSAISYRITVCVYRYLESDYRAKSSANVSTRGVGGFPA